MNRKRKKAVLKFLRPEEWMRKNNRKGIHSGFRDGSATAGTTVKTFMLINIPLLFRSIFHTFFEYFPQMLMLSYRLLHSFFSAVFFLLLLCPNGTSHFFPFSLLAFFFFFFFRFISFSVVIFRTSIYWTELNIMMHTASVSLFQTQKKEKKIVYDRSQELNGIQMWLRIRKKKRAERITVVVKWAKRVEQMYLNCRKKKWNDKN